MAQNRLPARYSVLEEVGQGGMAVVYRARDEALKREVAVKLLHPHLLAEPESKARLQREARAVAKLHHDNILQIYDYSGSDSESSYIVTEFIDGVTLKQFLHERKPPPPEVAALIAIEVGNALAHAHSQGIIHRDVKPENVMVRKDGRLKLMDFGLAQIVDFERMTVTGRLLGSPAYMAPEAIEGKPLDFRTDVFAVGIMLYQLATGALPFSGRNPHEVLKKIVEGRFADPRGLNRALADALCRIITRALARRPEDRYPSIAALLEPLQQFVREAGLEDVPGELRAFFTGVEAGAQPLPLRMTAALVANGRMRRQAGNTAAALELWNRALAIDPGNADVMKELQRWQGGRRLRRALGAVVGAVAVCGAVLVLRSGRNPAPSGGARPQAQGQHPAAAISPVTGIVPATGAGGATVAVFGVPVAAPALVRSAAPDAGRGSSSSPSRIGLPASRMGGVVHGALRPGNHVSMPRPSADLAGSTSEPGTAAASSLGGTSAPIAARRFTLGPTPKRVEVWLDGRKQFDYEPGHNTVDVPWSGAHVLEFRSPSCQPYRITLGPDLPVPTGDQIIAQLRWKDAFLVVNVQPLIPNVRVMVTEHGNDPRRRPARSLTPDPGARVPISFDGSEESRKTLDVTVAAGAKTQLKTVTVTAGETETLHVLLDE